MDVSRSDIEEGNVLMLNNSIKAEVMEVNDGYEVIEREKN